MLKYAAVLAIALVLAVSGGLGLARGGPDRPATGPSSAGADLQPAAPGAGQDLTSTVDALQALLRRLPGDAGSWAELGLAYVEQARLTGDPTYYVKAEAAVGRSLSVQPDDNAPGHAAAAALAAARHRFRLALAEARAALAVDPRQPGALAVRVDALTELGRYPQQLAALRVADRRQPGVPVAARYSYAAELRGRLDRATAVLLRAAAGASHSDRGFLLTQVAELDRRRGYLAAARHHLAQALRESPGYVPALASRARLAVAEGRLGAAERRWRVVVGRLPLPEYVTELGELELHLGRPGRARAQFDVVRVTVRLLRANGVDTDLETALFEADHGSPDLALRQALAEWRRRRSIHVADALGWALHVNGRNRHGLVLLRRATRLGTQESRLWLHRGLVESSLGMHRVATRDLRRGLAADPGGSPWLADRARAALGSSAAGRSAPRSAR